MKWHKLKIYGNKGTWVDGEPDITLWYVKCRCGWESKAKRPIRPGRHGSDYYGSTSWDLTLATGLMHLGEHCDC